MHAFTLTLLRFFKMGVPGSHQGEGGGSKKKKKGYGLAMISVNKNY
jgi:hypothetical protein